jgi:glycogen debranching enzyme
MPETTLQVVDRHDVLATAARVDDRTRVLKDGDTFAVFDRYGDVRPLGLGEHGIFHDGTRHLSRFELRFGDDAPPFLLGSTVRDDNAILAVDLTNRDIRADGELVVPADTVHVFRSAFLWDGALYQRLRLRSYAPHPVSFELALHFAADFVDIFEVRGTPRPRRGELLPAEVGTDEVLLSYRGLDEAWRGTRIAFTPAPTALDAATARYRLSLPPGEQVWLTIVVGCEIDAPRAARRAVEDAFAAASATRRAAAARCARVTSSNTRFNAWLHRSLADLHMMITETPDGPFPYAGIPWYSTVFGRDALISARQLLWLMPDLARGVLRRLAATQSDAVVPAQDAEPGKIIHEMRGGEMARLGEVPFGRYYGTADATPLFVMLAGAYWERSGDLAFCRALWPHVERALDWLDRYGDRDGDGFLEYARRSPNGLANQGWKDSHDAVFHRDGRLAEGPIALCEIQGYVFAAKRAAAQLAAALGHPDRAAALTAEAEALRERFEAAFWDEELGTYVLALDGEKRPCRVRTSNAGHALFAGIASPERAERVAATLLDGAGFSGWGVRTVASTEARYNPMSYHNGSVWPHDTALVALGLARYGRRRDCERLLAGLFDATSFLELQRLPELLCGFERRAGEGPTTYPVACSPQAWAVGAVFMLLEACLGLTVSAPERRISFDAPRLPSFLEELTISDLRVGDAVVDLRLRRHGDGDLGVDVLRRSAPVDVVLRS